MTIVITIKVKQRHETGYDCCHTTHIPDGKGIGKFTHLDITYDRAFFMWKQLSKVLILATIKRLKRR